MELHLAITSNPELLDTLLAVLAALWKLKDQTGASQIHITAHNQGQWGEVGERVGCTPKLSVTSWEMSSCKAAMKNRGGRMCVLRSSAEGWLREYSTMGINVQSCLLPNQTRGPTSLELSIVGSGSPVSDQSLSQPYLGIKLGRISAFDTEPKLPFQRELQAGDFLHLVIVEFGRLGSKKKLKLNQGF